MKVLQVVQKPQRRGAEIFAFQLSQQFAREGVEVRTVYLYPSVSSHLLPLRALDSVIGKNENDISEKFPGWNPRILYKLKRLIEEFNPNIIQLNAARTVKYGALLRWLNPNASWALIYRNIGDASVWQNEKMKSWLYKHCFVRKIDGIVAVSKKSLEYLKTHYERSDRIVQIPRAVDCDALKPAITREEIRTSMSTPLSSDVLLYVGSLSKEKRIHRLIHLLRELHLAERNVHLWIVGEGALRRELEEESARLGISPYIHFAGSSDDVASYMNAADLFVLSSYTEGIPGAVLEAAVLALPSVATRVGGVSDCVIDGQTGVLIDPENQDEMIAAVINLLDNPTLRKQMGHNARNWVHEHFTLEKIARSYLNFYDEILMFRSTRVHH